MEAANPSPTKWVLLAKITDDVKKMDDKPLLARLQGLKSALKADEKKYNDKKQKIKEARALRKRAKKARKAEKEAQNVLRSRWEEERRAEWATKEEDTDDEEDAEDQLCVECHRNDSEYECAKCEKPVCDGCTDTGCLDSWRFVNDVWMCPDCLDEAVTRALGQRIRYIELGGGGLARVTLSK